MLIARWGRLDQSEWALVAHSGKLNCCLLLLKGLVSTVALIGE